MVVSYDWCWFQEEIVWYEQWSCLREYLLVYRIIFPTLPHSALKPESPNATKTFLNACKFQGRANGWISISDVSSLPCLLTIRIHGIRSIYTLVSSLDVFWTLFIMLWLVLAQNLSLYGRCRQLANKLEHSLALFKAALTKDVIIWIEKSYWILFAKDIPGFV